MINAPRLSPKPVLPQIEKGSNFLIVQAFDLPYTTQKLRNEEVWTEIKEVRFWKKGRVERYFCFHYFLAARLERELTGAKRTLGHTKESYSESYS